MAVEFAGSEDFQQWLEEQLEAGRPRELAVALAARAALRALPGIGDADDETLVDIALPVLRATLTSAVAARCTAGDVIRAARSAALSARSAADSAYYAARSADYAGLSAAYSAARSAHSAADSADPAARSAYSAADSADSAALSAALSADAADAARSALSATRSAAYAALSADARHRDGDTGIATAFAPALWHDAGMPQGLATGLERLEAFFARDLTTWGFWNHWYRSHLEDGAPISWDLQEAVARIPNEHWEQTDERDSWDKVAKHIAGLITDIEARFVVQRAPLAETIVFDEAEGKFFREAIPVVQPDLLETTLGLIADSLKDALGGNGLLPGCWEEERLRRMLKDYSHDPQRIEMECVTVHKRIQAKLGGELPESDEIVALSDTLLTAALDIRAHHPEVAEARSKRGAQAAREATPEDIVVGRAALLQIEVVLREDFRVDYYEDAEEVLDALEAGEVPAEDAVTRAANRSAKMWQFAKGFGRGAGAVGGTAAGIVAINEAVPYLYQMWRFLAPFFGL
ncbi:MAG: hypothetical protein AAF667_06240 [Pseudomonadota bacterium]